MKLTPAKLATPMCGNKKNKRTTKRSALLNIGLTILILIQSLSLKAQVPVPDQIPANPRFSIGVKGGYDLPLFKMPYNELKYKGGRYFDIHADYRFPMGIGIRAEYANVLTRPEIQIPDSVYYNLGPVPMAVGTQQYKQNLKRHFVGIGPSYNWQIGTRFSILVSPMFGYSWLDGGDALVQTNTPIETHLTNTGFNTGAWAAKGDLDFEFWLTKKLSVNLGFYYLRHFNVPFDNRVDVGAIGGATSIYHGENLYDHTVNPYTDTGAPPLVFRQNVEEVFTKDLASVGVNLGLTYRFGKRPKKAKEEPPCQTCGCPDDTHKVVVTVRDEASRKVIPEADVAIKDLQGNIVATGTTNSFGVVDFGEIHHGNYTAIGNVYGVETTIASILDEEFLPDAVIQKEVLYTDLRFILKGKVVNKSSRVPESNVVVTLTDLGSGNVKQDNSDGEGAFVFRLNKNASYEVVGVKENILSDIERASTVGLTRSTTLFVDLELGVDDFVCGQGTVLDIKYDLDKWYLTSKSRFELDRLVRYMKDHSNVKVELSSHTDSRGSDKYNLKLSKNRAKSAVDYIISKGISNSRIIAKGYGESRLINHCANGVNCSEAEHRINRRTEAQLLCN